MVEEGEGGRRNKGKLVERMVYSTNIEILLTRSLLLDTCVISLMINKNLLQYFFGWEGGLSFISKVKEATNSNHLCLGLPH